MDNHISHVPAIDRRYRPAASRRGQRRPNPVRQGGVAAAIVVALSGSLALIPGLATAESPVSRVAEEDWQTPQTRLRPIGAPSAVDAHRSAAARPIRQAAVVGEASGVRQAVMMQADNFSMPAQSPSASGATSLPQPFGSPRSVGPITTPAPSNDNTPLPRPDLTSPPSGTSSNGSGLTPVPRSGGSVGSSQSSGPSGDYAPLAQPRLGDRFATLGNCRNISGPSSYRSDRILCAPPTGYVTTVGATSSPPVYAQPPAQLGPPTILPPTYDPSLGVPLAGGPTVIPGSPGYRPLISFGQDRFPVQVGQGILGQPVAYVPGQPVRNAIRYLSW